MLALLRRMRLPFERDGAKIRLSSAAIEKWLQPPPAFQSLSFRLQDAGLSYSRLARSLRDQQREIRSKSSYTSDVERNFDASWIMPAEQTQSISGARSDIWR